MDGKSRARKSTVISGKIHESPAYLCLGYPSARQYFKGKMDEVYFITVTDTTWDSAKHKDFTIFAQGKYYTEYIIDMSDVTGWTGKLKWLRLNPEHGATRGTFSIDYKRIESKN